MAVFRNPPTCPQCGEPVAEAIYRDQSHIPEHCRFIGDSFIGWNIIDHVCKSAIKGKFENILSVGMNKGEWDFSVRATIQDLNHLEMDKFRAMLMVAIGTAEDMWRRSAEKDSDKKAS